MLQLEHKRQFFQFHVTQSLFSHDGIKNQQALTFSTESQDEQLKETIPSPQHQHESLLY